jgi:hypothetical protein
MRKYNCYVCNTEKNFSEFYKDNSRVSKISSKCKECQKKVNKKRQVFYEPGNTFNANGNVFYVYNHIDLNGEIVYVGKGCNGRAWNTSRKEDHAKWMISCILDNIPFVRITHSRLTSSEALLVEREFILKYKPKFNFLKGD